MSTSENQAAVRRAIEEPFNRGNLAALDEVYAPGLVSHDPSRPQVTDLAGLKRFIGDVRVAYPDVQITIEDQFGEGDRVATRWTFRGTNAGPFADREPTGQPVELTGITVSRLEQGKIVEEWLEWDVAGLRRQIGLP